MGRKLLFPERVVRLPKYEAVTTSLDHFFGTWRVESLGKVFQAQFVGLGVPEAPVLEVQLYVLDYDADAWNVAKKLGREMVPITQIVSYLGVCEGRPVSMLSRGKDSKLYLIVPMWDESVEGWDIEAYRVAGEYEMTSGDLVAAPCK